MESLVACRVAAKSPNDFPRKQRRGSYVTQVEDPKTKQSLRIWSDEPLDAFLLDDPQKDRGQCVKSPEAVVVGILGEVSFVLFVELTQSLKPRIKDDGDGPVDPTQRKLDQLQSGILHFHPSAMGGGERSHGDDHHDAWKQGRDLPDPHPTSDHRVAGVVVGFHSAARTPAVIGRLGDRRVVRAVWSPVPSARGEADVTLRELLRNVGWP